MAKQVLVLLRSTPHSSFKVAEGLRMAVGLLIEDHAVTIALVETAALAALPGDAGEGGAPDPQKSMEALLEFGSRIWAEAGSLAAYGFADAPLRDGVERVGQETIEDALLTADLVIPY